MSSCISFEVALLIKGSFCYLSSFLSPYSSSCLSGLDKIEFLQSHDNPEIYRKSFEIIEEYFGQEEEAAQLVPPVEGQEFQFGAEEHAENLQF